MKLCYKRIKLKTKISKDKIIIKIFFYNKKRRGALSKVKHHNKTHIFVLIMFSLPLMIAYPSTWVDLVVLLMNQNCISKRPI